MTTWNVFKCCVKRILNFFRNFICFLLSHVLINLMPLPEKIRVKLFKNPFLLFSSEINGLNSYLYQFSNNCLRKIDIKFLQKLIYFPRDSFSSAIEVSYEKKTKAHKEVINILKECIWNNSTWPFVCCNIHYKYRFFFCFLFEKLHNRNSELSWCDLE